MQRSLVLFLLLVPNLVLAEESKPADSTIFRLDVEDGFALHPWIYHELRLTPQWGILGDIHVQTVGKNNLRLPPFLEFDLGPVLHLFNDLMVIPQVGVDFLYVDEGEPALGHTRANDIILQLYLIYSAHRISAESWNMYFIPFDGSEHFYMMRQLATIRMVADLSLGPHIEGNFFTKQGTTRLSLGGDLAYGFPWGTLTAFVAYESQLKLVEYRLTYLREL